MYVVPVVPGGKVEVIMLSRLLMVIVRAFEFVALFASVTLKVTVEVPADVGVPDITPV